MSDEAALLRAICDHPDDDTPRLVFADWLDEHDRPHRAEFIRVQCARARGGDPPAQRTELLKRSMQLVQQYGREWVAADWPGATAERPNGYTFDRGFVDTVSMARCGLTDARLAELLTTRPLFSLVRVWNLSMNAVSDAGMEAAAACPRLSRLRHLILSANPITARGLEALAASPHLGSLQEVTINYQIAFPPHEHPSAPDAPHGPPGALGPLTIESHEALHLPDLPLAVLALQQVVLAAQELFQRYGKNVRVTT